MEKVSICLGRRLIDMLLLHSSFIDNLGLLNGKTGIAIFFYHLARETRNSVYEDYAAELIDEIYEDISLNTPLDFEDGLAGIGWGIEYLVQNYFLEADTDQVLEEFDQRLSSLIYNFPASDGLGTGLAGMGAYLLKRIQNPNAADEKLQTLINKQHLIQVINEFDRRTQDVSAIIREPVAEQSSGSDSCMTQQGNNTDQEREAPVFDLMWDYPLLLWLFSEICRLNLYNVKVISIINRLLFPLLQIENQPRLHSNRLMLSLALMSLNPGKANPLLNGHPEKEERPEFFESIGGTLSVEHIRQNLLSGIRREAIAGELTPDCAFLRNGTTGIAWIYQKLFKLTADPGFKAEMDYWMERSLSLVDTHLNNPMPVVKENEKEITGIMKGYSGVMLTTCCHEKA